MIMMVKVDDDDDDGDGDNDGERLWWWLLSSDESYVSQRGDVLWRFACGDVFNVCPPPIRTSPMQCMEVQLQYPH